ncbi:hypothetical protein CEXT_258201 [Caerostris extrusa]|uniref:Uncharacterized protein n=1 Tax=Caerostris extrusa TaxID=172846 RepID=A0AAV4P382_CAEEX|nr:hypothetical protein CEXT_258201 [Caerostris extrusa]
MENPLASLSTQVESVMRSKTHSLYHNHRCVSFFKARCNLTEDGVTWGANCGVYCYGIRFSHLPTLVSSPLVPAPHSLRPQLVVR